MLDLKPSITTSQPRKESYLTECCQPLDSQIQRKGLIIMASDKHGMKDKVAGKFKEVEGKLTNDKSREGEGKLQKLKGKIKDKAADLRDDLKGKEEDKKEG